MKFRKSIALGAAAVTAATLGATAVVGGTAAGASARAGIPTVTVHVGGGKIGFVGGDSTLHAGRIHFRVITGSGNHILQILRLHHGYTLQQAGSDFGPAFRGNTAAIARLDDNITWRGGALARPDKPGSFVVTLRKGTFYVIDQNSNAAPKKLTVVGNVAPRPNVAHQSRIDAFSYGFDSTPLTIPAKGTTYFFNHADQPHFLEMQRVKDGTTAAQVRRFVKHPAGNPPFGLRAGTGAGVLSPGTGQMLSYNLPAGEYLLACFWPDRFTGMPHFFMGMWKLIHLA
jgi:uncharacterized cupredoxin-like copper-binding protein